MINRNTRISLGIILAGIVLGELEKVGTPEKFFENPTQTAKHVAFSSGLAFLTWYVRRPNEIIEKQETEIKETHGDGTETHLKTTNEKLHEE